MRKALIIGMLALVASLGLGGSNAVQADHHGWSRGHSYGGYGGYGQSYNRGYSNFNGYSNYGMSYYNQYRPSTGIYYSQPGLSISVGSAYARPYYGNYNGYGGYGGVGYYDNNGYGGYYGSCR